MDQSELDKIEQETQEKLKAKNRYEQLSEKVITTSKERDEAQVKAKAETERAELATKERDFYKDFSANVSKYPNASAYQDKILEKVKSGYSTEDAMVSVLAKEGKLSSPGAPYIPNAEGGSAPTNLEGPKSIEDMSRDEKWSALKEADKTGDLARALIGNK